MYKEKIRIGTMVGGHGKVAPADHIRQIVPHGFESFEITFGPSVEGLDLAKLAADVNAALAGSDALISGIGVYGNPLDANHPTYETSRAAWGKLVDAAADFGCDLVCGFTGAIVSKPIDENMEDFKSFFGPLAESASGKGVRIAFENCPMGGTWQAPQMNLAVDPTAWEMMFDAVPADNLGLEWEPCHQMVKLIDPMAQLRKWVGRMFHIHGKDATVMWDVVREYGVIGPKQFAYHRTPGFGDCNWSDIITELRLAGFEGAIDIEGWHDPVYSGELEMTGQVYGLNHLKQCRGEYVPNPE